MNQPKRLQFIPMHMPPPPSIMKEIIKKNKKENKAKIKTKVMKPTLRDKYHTSEQRLKVLCEESIPFLQNIISQRDNQIAQLENIVNEQESKISRKDMISKLKDDEIKKVKNRTEKKI